MIRSLISILGVTLIVFAVATPGAQRGSAPRERVLHVSVYDRETQKPVPDLGPEAFIVREDGIRREVLKVSKATSEMPIALLIDNSAAMSPAIGHLREALTAFIRGVEGLGPVSVITVADRPTIAADYTTSSKTQLDAVNRLFAIPSSGATLLEGISEAAKGLLRRESERAAIVLVISENVEFSTLYYRQVLERVAESGASLNAVVLRNTADDLSVEERRNRSIVLDRGPSESGGVRFDVLTSMGFESQLRALAAILSSQYRVVYARPESLIPPERVEVSMTNAGLEAHASALRGKGPR